MFYAMTLFKTVKFYQIHCKKIKARAKGTTLIPPGGGEAKNRHKKGAPLVTHSQMAHDAVFFTYFLLLFCTFVLLCNYIYLPTTYVSSVSF